MKKCQWINKKITVRHTAARTTLGAFGFGHTWKRLWVLVFSGTCASLCLLVVAYLERRHKRAQVGHVRAAGGKPAESWGTRVNRQGGGFMDYLTGHVVNSMKHSIPRIGLGGMREDRKD